MAIHAEYSMGGSCILRVLDYLLTITAFETSSAKGLITDQDYHVLNFLTKDFTKLCTIVANKRCVAQQSRVAIGFKKGATSIAP